MSDIVQTNHSTANSVGVSLDLAEGHLDHAATYERLGYSSLWIPGGQLSSLEPLTQVLEATAHVAVAPGIASLDVHSPAAIASVYADAESKTPGRLVLGLGGPQRSRAGALRAMREAVADLEDAAPPVPRSRRLLAALGPRKVDLARTDFAGAITLLVTPEFTRTVRDALGPATLVVHQMVVLESDADRARAAARIPLSFLATVDGYAASFRRMGFTSDDIDSLSDRLVDAVVAWGEADQIAERFAAHRSAGADQVVLSVLPSEGGPPVPTVAELLAPTLLDVPRVAPATSTR